MVHANTDGDLLDNRSQFWEVSQKLDGRLVGKRDFSDSCVDFIDLPGFVVNTDVPK